MLAQGNPTSLVPQKKDTEVKNMNIRAGLTNGNTITITGYDLELGKFDCTDGLTRGFDEFSYFIIPSEEFKSIGERLNEKIEKPVKPASGRAKRAVKHEAQEAVETNAE